MCVMSVPFEWIVAFPMISIQAESPTPAISPVTITADSVVCTVGRLLPPGSVWTPSGIVISIAVTAALPDVCAPEIPRQPRQVTPTKKTKTMWLIRGIYSHCRSLLKPFVEGGSLSLSSSRSGKRSAFPKRLRDCIANRSNQANNYHTSCSVLIMAKRDFLAKQLSAGLPEADPEVRVLAVELLAAVLDTREQECWWSRSPSESPSIPFLSFNQLP